MTFIRNIKSGIFAKALVLILLAALKGNSQGCIANFTYMMGANGQVTLQSTSTSTTALTSYSWNFGAPYLSPVSGTNAAQTITTYTANGSYIVILNISSSSPTCSSTFSAQITVTNVPVCIINYSNTPATSSTSCNGSGTLNTVGFCGAITYTWMPGNLSGAVQPTLCPGTYTVYVSANTTTGSCCPTLTSSLVTISFSPCLLNANFNHTVATSGLVNFSSTSSGTVPGSTYTWDFGDGSSTATGISTSHTYSSSANYSVWLKINNNSGPQCKDSVMNSISVAIITCSLAANFSSNQVGNKMISYSSTSTNTVSSSTYSWNFGDGVTANGPNVIHTYSLAGNYSVLLAVANDTMGICMDTVIKNQAVSTITCNLNPSFSHTLLAGGVTNFSSTSSGSSKTYFWDFGDGFSAITPAPSHTYSNAGSHFVKLRLADSTYTFCRDSMIQSINITGISCFANSVFTLVPSGTPQLWFAIPDYPYNVSAAIWNWGDGTISNGLYSSHVYSASSTYSICLSVTVSCGSNSSFCSTYYISKPSGAAGSYSVNVIAPALSVSLAKEKTEQKQFLIYPNPSEGILNLLISGFDNQSIKLYVFDLQGKIVFSNTVIGDGIHNLDVSSLNEGLYFMRIISEELQENSKLIIRR